MKSETAKLPKGQSYPLRPSFLEAELARAGVTIDVSLTRSPGNLFDVFFWPPNPNVPHERFHIRTGSVPSERAGEARQRMETITVPALLRWMADILAADARSPLRRERQSIDLVRP